MDKARKVQYLLKLLSEAASGRDIRQALPDLLTSVFVHSAEDALVKRLTYDVCKASYLTASESEVLLTGMKVDLKGGSVELLVASLNFLPSLAPTVLARMLEIGELGEFVEPLLSHDDKEVRSAAVSCMAAVLLVEDVLGSAASAVPMANNFTALWEALADSILDDDGYVTTAAVAAVARLLQAASSASARLPTSFLLQRVGSVTAGRILTALGPVLDACQAVMSQGGQAHVAHMLRLVAQSALGGGQGAGVVPPPLASSEQATPGLVTVLTALCSYWSSVAVEVSAGTRLEACRSVLHIVSLLAAGNDVSGSGPATLGRVALPTSAWAAEAIAALLDLEDMQLVEVGLHEVAQLVASHFCLLPPDVQPIVLRRLWAVMEKVQDVPRRMDAYVLTWHAVVEAEVAGRHVRARKESAVLQMQTEPMGLKLSSVLSDPYVSNVLRGSLYQPNQPNYPNQPNQASAKPTGSGATAGSTLPPSGSAQSPAVTELPSAAITAEGKKAATTDTAASLASDQVPPKPPTPSAPIAAVEVSIPAGQDGDSGKEKGKKEEKAEGERKGKESGPSQVDEKEKKSKRGVGLFKGLANMVRHGHASSASSSQPQAPAPPPPAPPKPPPAAAPPSSAHLSHSIAQPPKAPAQHPRAAPPTPLQAPLQAAARLVSRLDAPKAANRPEPQLSTLRHEMVISLLEVVMRQPSASTALHLCRGVAMSETRRCAMSADLAGELTEREEDVVHWATLAKSVLMFTSSCVAWEPLVTPAVRTDVSAVAQGHAAADFSTAPADAWLRLLQAACHTTKSLQAILRSQLHRERVHAPYRSTTTKWDVPAPAGNPYAEVSGGEGTAPSVVATTPLQKSLTLLLGEVDQTSRELQQLMLSVMKDWAVLSRAVRPRLAWVLAHYLSLPSFPDAIWDGMLRCVSDLLVRGGASSGGQSSALRLEELMSACQGGVLFKTSRTEWSKDKPFVFDIVAASAVCERPVYEAEAPLVALSCMQAMTMHLANHVCTALAGGGGWGGAAPPPKGEAPLHLPSPKQQHEEASLVAYRMEAMLREFVQLPDASSLPHLREWAKRVSRALSTLTSFQVAEEEEAVAEAVAEEGDVERAAADEGGDEGGTMTPYGVMPAHQAPPDSSSDSSSDYQPGGGDMPVFMPPTLYPPRAGAPPPAQEEEPEPSSGPSAFGQLGETVQAPPIVQEEVKSTMEPPGASFLGGMTVQGQQRVSAPPVGGPSLPTPYLLPSSVLGSIWGYPFDAPRSSILYQSKRSRRHRTLCDHLQSSMSLLAEGKEGGLGGLESGPVLSSNSMCRLDKRTFWDMLPGHPEHWEDLTGPADPILLCGSYFLDSSDDRTIVTIKLQATNRLDIELTDVDVKVKTKGALLAERCGINWLIPSLAPQDRAVHVLQAKLLGFSSMDVQCKLCLSPSLLEGHSALLDIHCQPLHISMAALLCRPKDAVEEDAAKFFNEWSSMPSRADITATCVWPGLEGQVLALSGALHQPGLSCMMLQYLPASGSFQAALRGESCLGELVLVLMVGQLLPPPSPGSPMMSLCQVMVRSSSAEIVNAVETNPKEWLADLTMGGLILGLDPSSHSLTSLAQFVPKPPVHPRIVHAQQAYRQSCTALSRVDGAVQFVVPSGPDGVRGEGVTAVGVADSATSAMTAGSRVGQRWLRGAAITEWRRMIAAR